MADRRLFPAFLFQVLRETIIYSENTNHTAQNWLVTFKGKKKKSISLYTELLLHFCKQTYHNSVLTLPSKIQSNILNKSKDELFNRKHILMTFYYIQNKYILISITYKQVLSVILNQPILQVNNISYCSTSRQFWHSFQAGASFKITTLQIRIQ